MKTTTGLGMLAAVALLAGGIGVAGAQTGTAPGAGTQPMQDKCWDAAMNQVRDRDASGAGTMTGSAQPGTTGQGTTASPGTDTTGSATPGTTGTADQDRPAHARGLPAC